MNVDTIRKKLYQPQKLPKSFKSLGIYLRQPKPVNPPVITQLFYEPPAIRLSHFVTANPNLITSAAVHTFSEYVESSGVLAIPYPWLVHAFQQGYSWKQYHLYTSAGKPKYDLSNLCTLPYPHVEFDGTVCLGDTYETTTLFDAVHSHYERVSKYFLNNAPAEDFARFLGIDDDIYPSDDDYDWEHAFDIEQFYLRLSDMSIEELLAYPFDKHLVDVHSKYGIRISAPRAQIAVDEWIEWKMAATKKAVFR